MLNHCYEIAGLVPLYDNGRIKHAIPLPELEH
jgi:hypothetical protein